MLPEPDPGAIEGWPQVFHKFRRPTVTVEVVTCAECGILDSKVGGLNSDRPYDVAKRHLMETVGQRHTVTMVSTHTATITECPRNQTVVEKGVGS